MAEISKERYNRLQKVVLSTKTALAATWVRAHNPSDGLPYHNNYHSETVALYAFEAGVYAKCSPSQLQSLVLAGLFHDYGHSGGKSSDTENIERALIACSYFCNLTGVDSFVKEEALRLIRCTEFPYKNEPSDELEKIMRDADMMQIMEENWEELLFDGLIHEQRRNFPDLSVEDFAKKSLNFYKAVELKSQWGVAMQDTFQSVSEQRVSQFLKACENAS